MASSTLTLVAIVGSFLLAACELVARARSPRATHASWATLAGALGTSAGVTFVLAALAASTPAPSNVLLAAGVASVAVVGAVLLRAVSASRS